MAFSRVYRHDKPETWAEHLERFQVWLDGRGTTTDDQKRRLFLDTLDDDTVKNLKKWIAPRTLREVTYEKIILKLDEKIVPSINWLVHYSAFVRRKQKDGELGTEFMSDLNTLASPCGFVLGQFVYGFGDRVVQSKLIEQFDTITETSALADVQEAEQAQVDTAKVRGDNFIFPCNSSPRSRWSPEQRVQ